MVPTLHRERGYDFRFWAGDRGELPHVHVKGNGGRAKIWLSPVRVDWSRGYSRRRIGKIINITTDHQEGWLGAWARFFGEPPGSR